MKDIKLDPYEEEILTAYDNDEFISVMTSESKKEAQQIAENTFKKDKRINIRISSRDLAALQKRALEEGIPYQTLISSVLHKYVSGSWREVISN